MIRGAPVVSGLRAAPTVMARRPAPARLTGRAAAAATMAAGLLLAAVPRGAAVPQGPSQTCVVIRDTAADAVWRSDATRCATRLSPASTFKIPHAVVALETGVVTPGTVEQWNGVQHDGRPKWDQDHTVESAMKPSVLWFFQRIAPRIGASRMHEWLERLRYGNARTDGDVTMYWVNGTLRISPEEQVAFLQRFYDERLPIRAEWQRLVRGALDQPPGTIENALGVATLDGAWPLDATWNAKTGRTQYGGRSVSWLVGRLSAGGRGHVFAAAVWRNDTTVDGLDAARAAVQAFVERGLVHRRGLRATRRPSTSSPVAAARRRTSRGAE